jgi:eukaryotic-like serine/threonine-protein kinase
MSTDPINPGDVLMGKYRVERLLGMGNMGVVVAAVHLGLDQKVAIKLMLPGKTAQAEQLARFLREARAAVRLRSQHVAKVLDVGTLESGAPYMVMEFLDGRDLASLLEGCGPLPIAEAVGYVLQVCEGIAEAHTAGIVHRDLKPANLFLTTDAGGAPCVKVIDFGVSKMADSDLKLTQDTQALGSPLYMSPEQMNASREVDARADIWALGVILFELIAGKTPFHAEQMQTLCTRVFFGEPTPIASLRADVPAGLEAVILQCLEKERDRRWPNVADLAAALAPFAEAQASGYAARVAGVLGLTVEPARATDVLPPEPAASRSVSTGSGTAALVLPRSTPRRRPIGIAVALVAGVVVAGLGVVSWRAAATTTPTSTTELVAPPTATALPAASTPDPPASDPIAAPSATLASIPVVPPMPTVAASAATTRVSRPTHATPPPAAVPPPITPPPPPAASSINLHQRK